MQAWGSLPRRGKTATEKKEDGMVHIQSFEIGVLVWPELFLDREDPVKDEPFATSELRTTAKRAIMVPTFGKDSPSAETMMEGDIGAIVGLRMPYDLPLTPYGKQELPWSPQSSHNEPDSKGRTWPPSGW